MNASVEVGKPTNELVMPVGGYSRAYKEGWNSASAGVLAHQNPYPNITPGSSNDGAWHLAGAFAADVPGQTNWNLWLSGFADYMASSFNCEARRRYMLFSVELVREFITVDAYQDEDMYSYHDGSYVILTKTSIRVFDRKGIPFIELPLDPLPENQ